MFIYLFILVAIFIRNLLLYLTYFSILTLILLCIENCSPYMIPNVFITAILCVTEEQFPILICF